MNKHRYLRILVIITFGILWVVGAAWGQERSPTHFEKAMALWNMSDYQGAIAGFQEELKSNPMNLDAYYNLGSVYEDAGDFYSAYFAWKRFANLGSGDRWEVKAKERMDVLKSERKVIFEGLKFKEVKLNNIFPSIYKYYASNPVGYTVIQNRSEETVADLRISFSVLEYMDFPTEIELRGTLKPGEEKRIDITAGFNNKVLKISEDTPIFASLKLSYNEGGNTIEKDRTEGFLMYNSHAMTWDIQQKLASFVTFKDPSVRIFTRNLIQMFKGKEKAYINDAVFKALVVFNALGVYGLTYIEDPVTPFSKLSETKDAVDFIQYPLDTLRTISCDCDDGVVLYSAMLESIGVPVALVDFPGHVLPMFNTGVSEERAHEISRNPDLYVVIEGKVWVPVETTIWGKSFTEAWHSAADRYRRTPEHQKEVIVIRDAWETYSPVTPEETGWIPDLPPVDEVEAMVFRDFESIYQEKIDHIKKNHVDLLAISVDDHRSHNKLGVVYGREILFEEALAAFKKALEAKPDFLSARANLAFAHYKLKQYEKSLAEFEKVLEEKPDSAKIHYNIGMINYIQRRYDQADEGFAIAVQLDPRYEKLVSKIVGEGLSSAREEGEAKASFAGEQLGYELDYDWDL